MEAMSELRAVLVSFGFDELKLRLDTVLEFLMKEDIFSLNDFEGGCVCHQPLNMFPGLLVFCMLCRP